MTKNWKTYLLWFAQEHIDFRVAEFNSLVKLFDLHYLIITEDFNKPFWIVKFPNDVSTELFASRSITLRAIFELWSHGFDYEQFHTNLQQYVVNNLQDLQCYFQKECSFKINVETYNKHLKQNEKIQKIESLNYLPLEGKVDLNTPRIEWWYIEFWGMNHRHVPNQPEDIMFGRWLFNGQRKLIKELSLKNRKFIGNTSMNSQLSLLMANQAMVKKDDLIFDPFVGTGSLLVGAAKFGAYVLGADINYMMLHARAKPSRITQKIREKNESILANLQQYNCSNRYMDVVVTDFSNSLWHDNLKLDSIITDPPYGIREATEKVESKSTRKENCDNTNDSHYPSTSHYALHHIYLDLLQFSSKHLVPGGRLVCWLPLHKDDFTEEIIPKHPNLSLISNSMQKLTGRTCRVLLTYEKKSDYELIFTKEKECKEIQCGIFGFRERYFATDIETRWEKRLRKVAERERGRLEALKRGKTICDGREFKCYLNKKR